MDNKITIQFPIYAMPPLTEEKAIQELMTGLNTLIEVGAIKGPIDEALEDYDVNLDSGYVIAHLAENSLVDGSKLNTVGASGIYEVPKDLIKPIDLSDFDKTFSAATIQERLRLVRMNPKLRLRYMVMDYKRYYRSKEKEFEKSPEKFKQVRDLFLNDLMGLFNEVLPLIEDGKQLNSLIGVSQVSPKMSQIARELSLIYRRALKTEKSSGQINKGIFQKLKSTYAQFMDQLTKTVFPGSEKLLGSSGKSVDSKTHMTIAASTNSYSYCSDGRIRLFSELTEDLEDSDIKVFSSFRLTGIPDWDFRFLKTGDKYLGVSYALVCIPKEKDKNIIVFPGFATYTVGWSQGAGKSTKGYYLVTPTGTAPNGSGKIAPSTPTGYDLEYDKTDIKDALEGNLNKIISTSRRDYYSRLLTFPVNTKLAEIKNSIL